MTFDYLKTLDVGDLQGASMEEINRAEAAVGIPFPEVYKDFLAVLGKNSGHFFSGATYQVSQLEWMNTFYREKVKDMEHIDLSNKYLVIIENQGYAFYALQVLLDPLIVPNVYFFIEDEKGNCTFEDIQMNFEVFILYKLNIYFFQELRIRRLVSMEEQFNSTISYIDIYNDLKSKNGI